MTHWFSILGSLSTRQLGRIMGSRAPYLYVIEFPKSGGTWLSQMLASYFGISRACRNWTPPLRRSVVHSHWPYTPRLHKPIYLYRDGRDTCVSMYFHLARLYSVSDQIVKRKLIRRFPMFAQEPPSQSACAAHLPAFVSQWLRRPWGTPLSWPQHVGQWSNANTIVVSYEELLADAYTALSRIVSELGEDVDEQRITAAVDEFAFKKQTGRKPGEAQWDSFLRKGVAGDWKNHFGYEAAKIFDDLAGQTLIDLGYEDTRDWFGNLAVNSTDVVGLDPDLRQS